MLEWCDENSIFGKLVSCYTRSRKARNRQSTQTSLVTVSVTVQSAPAHRYTEQVRCEAAGKDEAASEQAENGSDEPQ